MKYEPITQRKMQNVINITATIQTVDGWVGKQAGSNYQGPGPHYIARFCLSQ